VAATAADKPFGDGPLDRLHAWMFDTPDVAIAGGAATVNQYLAAGLLDEVRTHITPVTPGVGERLFDGVPPLQLEILAARAASLTSHISYRVRR
jgi:dihydrofolate reductase